MANMGVGSGGATRAMALPRFRAVGPKYVLALPLFRPIPISKNSYYPAAPQNIAKYWQIAMSRV